jgi:LPXTG-motif cell wall-anchored protein
MRSRRLAAATTAAVLALPATAFAGGAGDDQYQDPFADEPAQTQQQAAPSPTDTHGDAQRDVAPGGSAPDVQPAQPVTASPALPRTGADAGLTALGGGALLLAGLALRRRTADGVHR